MASSPSGSLCPVLHDNPAMLNDENDKVELNDTSSDHQAATDDGFVLFTPDSIAQKEQHNAKVLKEYGFIPTKEPAITDGSVLPEKFEPVNSFFYNKPIEEIEYGINETTFCVLSKKLRKTFVHRFTATKSCFLFSPWNPLRKLCIALVTSQYFEYFMMFVITSNFILHMFDDDAFIPVALRLLFLILYTLEMLIKSIAYGFAFGKHTYLRDSWNWLDFIFNLDMYIYLIIDYQPLDVLRMFRLLRILSHFNAFAPIFKGVNRFMKMLFQIMMLAVLFLSIFALIGVELYSGTFGNKCVENNHLDEMNISVKMDPHRTEHHNSVNPWEVSIDFEYHTCGNASGTIHCRENATCFRNARTTPNYGYTNFDDFRSAMLTTFQIMSLSLWNQVYDEVVYSTGPFGIIFFILIIFLGTFYLLNLVLAALVYCFRGDTEHQESISNKPEFDATMEETLVNGNKSRQGLMENAEDLPDHNCACCTTCCCCWRYNLWLRFQRCVRGIVTNRYVEYFIVGCIIGNTLAMALDHHNMPASLDYVLRQAYLVFLIIFVIEMTLKLISWSRDFFKDSWNTFDLIIVVMGVLDLGLENVAGVSVARALRMFRILRLSRTSQENETKTSLNALRIVVGKTFNTVGDIAIILFIIAFIFGVFGKHMTIPRLDHLDMSNITGPSPLKPEGRLHFLTITHSIFLIFRVMFGDWIQPLTQSLAWPEHNHVELTVFVALVLGKFVFLNTLLAIIITTFQIEETTNDNKHGHAPSRLTRGWLTFKNRIYTCCTNPVLSPVPGEESKHRQKVNRVVEHRLFEWIVILIVLVNTITLCLEDVYQHDNDGKATALQVLNGIFCTVYILEAILKLAGRGFYSYFSHGSTLLEFIIALNSLLNVSLVDHKDWSVLRALVPLRVISRWKAMQVIGSILVSTVPRVLYVALISSIFWTLFAIMGVQMFAGKFHYCVNDDFDVVNHTHVPNVVTCYAMNFTWIKPTLNFDNVVNGYVALLQLATFQNWEEVTSSAVDSTLVHQQPVEDFNIHVYWYFFIFLLFGAFYPFFLFIGIIVENFNKHAKKHEGGVMSVFLSERWGKYLSAMQTPDGKPWERPSSKIQAFCYDLTTNLRFEIFMFVIILLNMICLVARSFDMYPHVLLGLEIMNFVITFVLIVEAVIKIMGMRRRYFKEPWNLFDFIIVIFGILEFISEVMLKFFGISISSLMRIFRVLRLVRLLRIYRIRRVDRVLNGKFLSVITRSLPAHFTLSVLLFLVMFIYAIMGTLLFSHVKHDDVLNEFINFETVNNSMILLFRLFTAGWWYDVLESLKQPVPFCEYDSDNCGKPFLAMLFFASYFIVNFMIVTIYTAIILHNFKEVHQQLGVTADDLDSFFITWTKYDPNATQFISLWDLPNFIHNLEFPLRIAKPNGTAIVSFNLPIARGTVVHCMDVLSSLVKHKMGKEDQLENLLQVQELTDHLFKKYFKFRNHGELEIASQEWDKVALTQRLDNNTHQHPNASVKMEAEP